MARPPPAEKILGAAVSPVNPVEEAARAPGLEPAADFSAGSQSVLDTASCCVRFGNRKTEIYLRNMKRLNRAARRRHCPRSNRLVWRALVRSLV